MTGNKPEILAPCGNMTSLKAAIAAGADACYLAGNSFGARAYADNFSETELLEAIDIAHLHDVKIYLTANTLVKENEMYILKKSLIPLYEAGLDAVLVQDNAKAAVGCSVILHQGTELILKDRSALITGYHIYHPRQLSSLIIYYLNMRIQSTSAYYILWSKLLTFCNKFHQRVTVLFRSG